MVFTQLTLDTFINGSRTCQKLSSSLHAPRVMLPWSPANISIDTNGENQRLWDFFILIFQKDRSRNTSDLRRLMQVLLLDFPPEVAHQYRFEPLCHVIDGIMEPAERSIFFDRTLPWMKRCVLRGSSLFPNGLSALKSGAPDRLTFSHHEANTLLSCGFFSLFPQRFGSVKQSCSSTPVGAPLVGPVSTKKVRSSSMNQLPPFNFLELLSCNRTERFDSQCAKVRCILEYFTYNAQHNQMNTFSPSLHLFRLAMTSFPDFKTSSSLLSPVQFRLTGRIEDSPDALQVDFANRVIGGGVLRTGCVQEEMRFVVCPELLLARLVSEPLLPNEALVMDGARAYSRTKGYASTFRFVTPESPMGVGEWRPCCTVAMDADFYGHDVERQYTEASISRETRKAFVGFQIVPDGSSPAMGGGVIATGHWGCGAFHGNREVKFLVQWCAASEAGRPLMYYTFEDEVFYQRVEVVYAKLQRERWTVGDLYSALVKFHSQRGTSIRGPSCANAAITSEGKNVSSVAFSSSPRTSTVRYSSVWEYILEASRDSSVFLL